MKHIDIDNHFVRTIYDEREIGVKYVHRSVTLVALLRKNFLSNAILMKFSGNTSDIYLYFVT